MYSLRPRIKPADGTLHCIPDIFGKTQTYIRDNDGYIDTDHLFKDMGLCGEWKNNINATKWISPSQLIDFAKTINTEWSKRLMTKFDVDRAIATGGPFEIKRSHAKRDKKLRKRHACTFQAIYGAVVGKNRFKIGFTSSGFSQRMVDLSRKLGTAPVVSFVHKVKNPKMMEKKIFTNPFLQRKRVVYKGIKNEVFDITPREIKLVKRIVKDYISHDTLHIPHSLHYT